VLFTPVANLLPVSLVPVSLILVANLPLVLLVLLIPVVHFDLRIHEFLKKFETVLMGYSGAGGKLIHEKNRGKNLVTLSL
jgi:hypothetical protein